MISVVSVFYGEKESSAKCLLKSLEAQTASHELILMDNTKDRFRSVAAALNEGGRKAKGKYIMFVHPDVDLISSSWIGDAEKILDSAVNLGIAGVAGMSEEGRTNKERGRNVIKSIDKPWEWGNPIHRPEPVQTLDECLVVIPKCVFDRFKFDEETCDSWHLYAVDYCLSIRSEGLHAYAIPMYVHHRSENSAGTKYMEDFFGYAGYRRRYYPTLVKVLKKHRGHAKRIYTTCGTWSTACPLALQRIYEMAFRAFYHLGVLLGLRFIWRVSGLKDIASKGSDRSSA
ncbi:MAG: glycosyltransferase [Candidatus Omnitrophota bacterium]